MCHSKDGDDLPLGSLVPADADTAGEVEQAALRADLLAAIPSGKAESKNIGGSGTSIRRCVVLRRHCAWCSGLFAFCFPEGLVRQLEAEALRKLRHPAYGAALRAYLDDAA